MSHRHNHHKTKKERKEALKIKPQHLILRCYAEKKGNVWQAFCLDFNLAVQGDTAGQVRAKLHEQITEYIYDALEGEDQAYAGQFLKRRAPFKFWAKYYISELPRPIEVGGFLVNTANATSLPRL